MSVVLTPAPAATTTPPPAKQPAPVAPPATTWQAFRWTIEQYRELGRFTCFQDVKTMLIDGEIYIMPPPKPPHDLGLNLTYEWLRSVFMPACHVRCQMGFDI